MKPPIWEARSPESERDILAEERLRKPRRRWWPGNWLTGRVGAVVLVVFIVGGLGWVVTAGSNLGSDRSRESFDVVRVKDPEAGRLLTLGEQSLASSYGVPLHLGDGGLPVVRHKLTGEVREMTPVEVEFGSSEGWMSAGRGSVVWTPGPRGWGVWWEDQTERRLLRPDLAFARGGWKRKQHSELSYAVGQVSDGLRMVRGMDFDAWRTGMGPVLADRMGRLGDRYPVVDYGHWAAVPGQWVCDPELESDLNEGVTHGCPGELYLGALSDAWARVGSVVDLLEGMGKLGAEMDGMASDDLYQSELLGVQSYALGDVVNALKELKVSLERLWKITGDRGLPISVRLFGEG